MGAVKAPGTYPLPVADSDLLAALVAAGGLTDKADGAVEIRHPARAVATLSADPRSESGAAALASFTSNANDVRPHIERLDLAERSAGQATGGRALEDGAIVTVAARPPQYIHVMGLVRRPDQFALPANRQLYVLDAIAMAGGLTVSIADKIYVIRRPAQSRQAIVIQLSLRAAKKDGDENLRLMAGDVVSVEETPATFVVGLVQHFLNIGVGVTGRVPF
jgi:protein involved in polysaccharide export with SLBB domain